MILYVSILKKLFKGFPINTTFLNEDFFKWVNNGDYNKALLIIKKIFQL